MKKFIYTLISLSIVAFAACNKIETAPKTTFEPGPAPETFTVNVPGPQTKTVIDGVKVKWSVGDQIRVYGHNTSTGTYTDNGTYTLDTGDGTTSAVFAKDDPATLTGTYDAFYAVYPATRTLTFDGSPLKMQLDKVSKTQTAVDNSIGFDPSFAVMTAAYDGSKLAFRHGAGYIKFVLTEDEVSSVEINLGSNCLVQQPTYLASDGSYSAGGTGTATVTLTPAGSAKFVKGAVYYAPVFPRPDDSKKISGLTVTCTGGSTYTTTHFNGLVVEYGKIFDLGVLTKTTISAIDITGVDVAGVSTTHTISFKSAIGWTPSIQSYTGCVSSASLASTDVITTDPSEGTINYTVGAYDALVGKTGTIVVRLSKAGESPIDKTINVTQNTSTLISNTYLYYINDSGAEVNTSGMFTGSFSNGVVSFSSTDASGCGADSFEVEELTITKGLKFNGSGNLSFTTSSTLNSKVTFYYACRKSGDNSGARIKITPEGGSSTVYGSFNAYGTVSSQLNVALAKGTTYTIARDNKELALVLVKLVETNE